MIDVWILDEWLNRWWCVCGGGQMHNRWVDGWMDWGMDGGWVGVGWMGWV